jgi:Ankyrin repeats (3 copies)
VGAFEGPTDSDYLQVLRKLAYFINLRQLMDAASVGDSGRVKYLLKRDRIVDLEIDEQNWLGSTALHESTLYRRKRLGEYLVNIEHALARILDYYGNTALHFAVENRSLTAVRLLLEIDADVNAENLASNPKSPLQLARNIVEHERKNKPKIGQASKSREQIILWLLTHRPFLQPPKPSSFISKVRNHPASISFDAVKACKLHVITAIEFFKDGKSVIGWNSVLEMLYSSSEKGQKRTMEGEIRPRKDPKPGVQLQPYSRPFRWL